MPFVSPEKGFFLAPDVSGELFGLVISENSSLLTPSELMHPFLGKKGCLLLLLRGKREQQSVHHGKTREGVWSGEAQAQGKKIFVQFVLFLFSS